MTVDERARHRLYRKLEEVLGREEAGILMDHLPPRGFGDLATKGDLELMRAATKADIDGLRTGVGQLRGDLDRLREDMDRFREEAATKTDLQSLKHELSSKIDRSARQLAVWGSGMVLATGGLAFTAARFV